MGWLLAALLILGPPLGVVSDPLAPCISDVMRRFFPPSASVAVSASADVATPFLQQLHRAMRWSVLLARSEGGGVAVQQTRAAVLVVTSAGDVGRQLAALQTLKAWSLRSMVAVAVEGVTNHSTVRSVLAELRRARAADAIVLAALDVTTVEVRTWFPSHGVCGEDDFDTVLLDRWSVAEERFSTGADLFPTKSPQTLRGCSVRVSTFSWSPFVKRPLGPCDGCALYERGVEVMCLKAMAQKMNFSLKYLPEPPDNVRWGSLLPNGSWTGLLGNLHSGRADVACASFTGHQTRVPYFDNTISYFSNAVTWVLPRAGLVPRWKNLLRIFSLPFWMVVLGSFLMAIGVFWILDSRQWAPGTCSDVVRAFMTAWSVLLEQSPVLNPRDVLLKAFLWLWLMYCMQISTAYKSSLVSVLTEPAYERQIATVEELQDSEMEVRYTTGLLEYFGDFPAIKRRSRLCIDIKKCLGQVAHHSAYAILSDRAYVDYLTPGRYSDGQGKSLLYLLADDVMTYPVVMFVAKGSPLLERFDAILWRLVAAGLLTKWRDDLTEQARYQHPVHASEELDQPLAMSHLQSAFYVLLLGSALASAALGAECVRHAVVGRVHRS